MRSRNKGGNKNAGSKTNRQAKVERHDAQMKPIPNSKAEPATSVEGSHFADFQRIQYLDQLVAKQLQLYDWCEAKVSTLATINSILLAGATLFVEHINRGIFPGRAPGTWLNELRIGIESNISIIMMFGLLLPVILSLAIALYHVIPKMNSGATSSEVRNHRSANGIHKHKSIAEYKEHIDRISEDEIYLDLVRQIYGTNRNIWSNQKSIRIAVYLDLVGLLVFLCIVVYLVFNGNGAAIFG